MNKLTSGFVLLVFLSSFCPSSDSVDFQSLIVNRFNEFLASSLQEKVYLQTDKPYYSAGENIWFKGYLVNATFHTQTPISSFLYVELVDQADSVCERIKVKKDSLGFSGNLTLNADLQYGNYLLRAYTNWMRNISEDFYFTKPIYIGNKIDDRVLCDVFWGEEKDGEMQVVFAFKDALGEPYKDTSVRIRKSWERVTQNLPSEKTDESGNLHLKIAPVSVSSERNYVEIFIDNEKLKFQRKFYLPHSSDDFDVQFFPESGPLLASIMQVVGVKAIGSDGLSVEVSGEVYSDKGESLAQFSTTDKGMGKFIFQPLRGEAYYAVVKLPSGLTKRFELPAVEEKGVAVHLGRRGQDILYQVSNKSGLPVNSLYLLVHSRGMVYALQPLNSPFGKIAESVVPAGIVSFSVIDTLGNTYCERLYFKIPENLPSVEMECNKQKYYRREPVELDFTVKSSSGEVCSGDFSISVTDNRLVHQDRSADNIVTNLLLTSDLKGYVEKPASYFRGSLAEKQENLDLLMLTQGWRRFNTAEVVRGKTAQPTHFLEASQVMSGKVKNLLGRPSRNCEVVLYSTYNNMVLATETDSLGRYYFDGLEFPDSTQFFLNAKRKNAFVDVELVPDSMVFEKPSCFIPEHRQALDANPPEDYFVTNREKYFNEGGMRVVELAEITVEAEEIKRETHKYYYSGSESAKLSMEDIENLHVSRVLDLIARLPGVFVSGDNISIRHFGHPAIFVDGIYWALNDVKTLSPWDIAEISVFKDANAAIFGIRGANGAIAISLRKGSERRERIEPVSIAHLSPLGYSKPEEFYVPKYDVDSIRANNMPDLRTTIYWNPSLKVNSQGVAHVKFFTADKLADYSITLEGITSEGEMCHFQEDL